MNTDTAYLNSTPRLSLRAVEQVPGVVVMEIQSASVAGAEGGTEDPRHKRIVVVFNARPDVYEAAWPAGQHPSPADLAWSFSASKTPALRPSMCA